MAPVVALRWSDSPQMPRTVACLFVVLLHALLGAWLWQGSHPGAAPGDDERISLRWLPALPQPNPPRDVPVATPTAPTPARPARRLAPVPLPPADVESDSTPTQAPLLLGLPAGSIDGGDGITAAGVAPRLTGRREVHPAFAPRRNYFRIRRTMTPEQIVHGVAQLLGLWPPGYIVDPCQLGKQDMDYFQGAVEEMDRQALRDAVLVVSARCP
ncbi:hypothetical protein [uncultured Stenotrophomonas sp.]|uniref:hypothetical protein n=1 Tax=uncultured Stenotrophomonas sp. TaxID=165438 RepID=UPI0025F3B34B|nr:hypothetical protein [uncultured Stenotrophomonas sp.]